MFLFNNRCETTSILRSEITYQWVEPSLASGACDLRAFSLVPSRFQSPTKSQTSRFDCCSTDNLLSSIGDQNTRLRPRLEGFSRPSEFSGLLRTPDACCHRHYSPHFVSGLTSAFATDGCPLPTYSEEPRL